MVLRVGVDDGIDSPPTPEPKVRCPKRLRYWGEPWAWIA